MNEMRGTTIIGIKRDRHAVIAGDGQVTLGNTVIKSSAQKIRKLSEGQVIAGFAGATADAFTLFDKFEAKLKECKGNLKRAAVELAKDWRSDRILRRLEAMIIVADSTSLLLISGTGDVLEPDDGMMAIGSGGSYALAAARAYSEDPELTLRQIAEKSLQIAADICIYTNRNITLEEI
ncbi:MAG: ATP-dependent protease subunit HslV [Candidatus Cloacimonetes bacterium]|nr:ATP-dependent protease subunit HslV [Candidatus Cloacimonadota bacterium]